MRPGGRSFAVENTFENKMHSGPLFDTMVRKVSRRTCREVLRCQLTRCTLQTRPGPVSSRVTYPQRMLVTGSARARTPGARILKAVPPARIFTPAWMTGTPGDWDPAGHSPAGRDRHPGVDDWDPDAGAPPAGAVFAQGRWGDGLAPDPVLATLLDLAGREGLEQLDDDQLTGVLQAAARLASWSASLKLAATSRLAARREEDGKQTGDWRPFDHVDDEVAVALTLTRRSAGRLVELALGPGPAAADPRGALRGVDRRAPR